MPNTLQFRRGAVAGLPSLSAGEPGFTTDQFRLYVGSSGGNRLVGLLHKNDATTAPTVNEDAGDGYSVGSRWIDTTADKSYVCVDSTVGAAVWQQTSGAGTGGITQLTGDATAGPGSGSQALTLANSGVSAGSYGGSSAVPVLTFDAKGRCTSATTAAIAAGAVPRGHGDGLTLSYGDTTQVNVAVGQCADTTGAYLLEISSAFSKLIQGTGSWTAGSGNNGLDTGARASSTWYHVWVIAKADGTSEDILFSTSATAPSMPSTYTLKQRIGSVKTNGSGLLENNWLQDGDRFMWLVPVDDVSAANPGTSAVTRALSTPPGVRTLAFGVHGFNTAATGDNPAGIYLSDLAQTNSAPSANLNTMIAYSTTAHIANARAPFKVRTDTSSSIRSRCQLSSAGMTLVISTHGWIDPRWRT